MFGRKKESKPAMEYNPETMQPVLKCSICTGEQVAGFKDKATGKFTGVTLIKNNTDLDYFKQMYQIEELAKEY